MENKFRNEMEIKLGGQLILLRPTFENIAAMESSVGSVNWLTWKFSRGHGTESAVKNMPSMTDAAKIIYFNQASTKPEDSNQKKFSLEEIWDLVQAEGGSVIKHVIIFLGRLTAGNRAIEIDELSEGEKKS